MGFYTKSTTLGSGQLQIRDYRLSQLDGLRRQHTVLTLDMEEPNAHIVEFGIYCSLAGEFSGPIEVLDLYALVVRPRVEVEYTCSLTELEIYHRLSGENSEQRLRWAFHGSQDTWRPGLPWSDTTGPFSGFTIKMDDQILGQAHCLEFPLRPDDWLQEGKDKVEFLVQGHLFGGGAVFGSLTVGCPEGQG